MFTGHAALAEGQGDRAQLECMNSLAEIGFQWAKGQKLESTLTKFISSLVRERNLSYAEKAVLLGLQISPDNIYFQTQYAKILAKQGKSQKAIEILSPLRAANPDNAHIAATLARALSRNKQGDEARKIVDALIEKNPNDQEARGLRIRLLIEAEDWENASKYLKVELQKKPTAPENLGMAFEILVGRRNLAKAERLLEIRRGHHPEDPAVEEQSRWLRSLQKPHSSKKR